MRIIESYIVNYKGKKTMLHQVSNMSWYIELFKDNVRYFEEVSIIDAEKIIKN